MPARIVWQAQARDDLVTTNVINQLILTSTAKQKLKKKKYSKGKWREDLLDEFISHIETLYELTIPLTKIKKTKKFDPEDVFDEKIPKIQRIKLAFVLWRKLIVGLSFAGIWNISKSARLSSFQKGGSAVRGI